MGLLAYGMPEGSMNDPLALSRTNVSGDLMGVLESPSNSEHATQLHTAARLPEESAQLAPSTESSPPRHTASAAIAAQHDRAPVQQAAQAVNSIPADVPPTIVPPDLSEEQQGNAGHILEHAAPASAQSNQPPSLAPESSEVGGSGGRVRRERRPRMNPDGTLADAPGTGRYVGGGTGGKQGGPAPKPSSKKRAKGKQAGPQVAKKKR